MPVNSGGPIPLAAAAAFTRNPDDKGCYPIAVCLYCLTDTTFPDLDSKALVQPPVTILEIHEMTRITASMIALIVTSACATTTQEFDHSPTVSATEVENAFAEANAIGRAPLTTFDDLPTGSVTYTGKLGADVSGDANGSILGDLNMNVSFARNTVGGDVRNINLIDPDGRPNQRFEGRLLLDGVETDGQIDSFASGDLTGVDVHGDRVDTQMLLILEGDVRDDFGRGDAVYGSATGRAEGDFDLDVDGVFYGSRN